jgi:hypothetical protein
MINKSYLEGFELLSWKNDPVFIQVDPSIPPHVTLDFAIKHNIANLTFHESNWQHGWEFRFYDFNFLRSNAFLKSIRLHDKYGDVSFINSLINLEWLDFSWREVPCPIDFGNLPHLRRCEYYWQNGIGMGLGTCAKLEYLHLIHYPAKDLGELAGVERLRYLRLTNPKLATLDGLGNWGAMEELMVQGASGLADVSALGQAANLRSVWLESAKRAGDLSALARLPKLEKVYLYNVGEVTGLGQLANSPSLRSFHVSGGNMRIPGRDADALRANPNIALTGLITRG